MPDQSGIRFLQIEQEHAIHAPVHTVWHALTEHVQSWWGMPYLLWEDARGITLESHVGGRFYEDWAAGQGALWGIVTAVKRDSWIEIAGSIGMSGAVHGILQFSLEACGDGTSVKLIHQAFGAIPATAEAEYAESWRDLLGVRLKAYVEDGTRYGLGHLPPAAR